MVAVTASGTVIIILVAAVVAAEEVVVAVAVVAKSLHRTRLRLVDCTQYIIYSPHQLPHGYHTKRHRKKK